MTPFNYLRPNDLAEASAIWAEYGTDARLLAGGTDLTVGLRHGHITTKTVIDLKRVVGLQADITRAGNSLRVSAGTTMSAVETYLRDEGLFPALRDAAAVVGSIQIRNRATLAGNICNASPAADTVPVLAALGASVEVAGPDGTRTQLVKDFITGNRQLDLKSGEIVVAVLIPIPQTPQACAFERITRRRGVDLATANLCCSMTEGQGVAFAFGSVAPRPLLVHSDADVLRDPTATKADRVAILTELCAIATPISDVRASAAYRTAMLRVMAERALSVAKNRMETPAHVR